jgi:hypothetical protein
MYDLQSDPNERWSLVDIHGTPPTVRKVLPEWADRTVVQTKLKELQVLLLELEARFLS